MDDSIAIELKVILYFLSTLAGISTLLYSFFKMLDARQSEEEREQTKEKYDHLLKEINDLKFNRLPQRFIQWLLKAERKVVERGIGFFDRVMDRLENWKDLWQMILFAVLLTTYMAIALIAMVPDSGWNIWMTLYIIFGLLSIVIFILNEKIDSEAVVGITGIGAILILIIPLPFIITKATQLPVLWSSLVLLALIPLTGLIIGLIFIILFSFINIIFINFDIGEERLPEEESSIALGLVTSLSFSLTMFSLFLGNVIVPSDPLPQTPQLLLINVLFDGLTIWITFGLLRWSVAQESSWRIPFALLLDILFAAIFACCALYLGLWGTEYGLSMQEVTQVLFARSPNGEPWKLGPYFWAMHTTFIPTLIYITLFFFLLIAKYGAIPLTWTISGGTKNTRPHLAIGTTFGFFAVFCTILGSFLLFWFR